MLRIIKYFDMPLPGVAVQRLAFTADPGRPFLLIGGRCGWRNRGFLRWLWGRQVSFTLFAYILVHMRVLEYIDVMFKCTKSITKIKYDKR